MSRHGRQTVLGTRRDVVLSRRRLLERLRPAFEPASFVVQTGRNARPTYPLASRRNMGRAFCAMRSHARTRARDAARAHFAITFCGLAVRPRGAPARNALPQLVYRKSGKGIPSFSTEKVGKDMTKRRPNAER